VRIKIALTLLQPCHWLGCTPAGSSAVVNVGGHNAANGRMQLLAFALTIVVLESEQTILILTTA